MKQNKYHSPSFLIYKAWKDSLTIEEEEILPLVTITRDHPDILWNQAFDHVLMLSFHRHPEYYTQKKEINLSKGEIWVTSYLEMKHWYENNETDNEKESNWVYRFEQLLGVDSTGTETHFTGFWISPDDLIRPAYNPNAASSDVWDHFPEDFHDKEYIQWFQEHADKAYRQKKLPWTRLGYTYDWKDNGIEYGLSEFLVKKDAPVTIAFNKTISEFISLLEKGVPIYDEW